MSAPDPEALRILREWDVPASIARYRQVMKNYGVPARDMKDENAIAGMHKARIAYGAALFTADQVAQSHQWLRDHGFKSTIGLRLP
jgi:hypothetical protein